MAERRHPPTVPVKRHGLAIAIGAAVAVLVLLVVIFAIVFYNE